MSPGTSGDAGDVWYVKSSEDIWINRKGDPLRSVLAAGVPQPPDCLSAGERRKIMRVNVYAEEMTDRVEIISKEIDGHKFTGLRLYLELPVTLPTGENFAGPFMHRPGDDDSAAVTFWGKRDLREVLRKMLAKLDEHYEKP